MTTQKNDDPKPVKLSRAEIAELFGKLTTGNVYQKRGDFLARPTVINEMVLTIVNGIVETFKTTSVGEWVILNITTGLAGERYCISSPSYEERYKPTTNTCIIDGQSWFRCEARGYIEAAQYLGEDISFTAPWDEEMIMQHGDFLGRPWPCDNLMDIYRVEQMTFGGTYGTKPIFHIDNVPKEVLEDQTVLRAQNRK
jgi:tellurite resistance-related uncharacterized protein